MQQVIKLSWKVMIAESRPRNGTEIVLFDYNILTYESVYVFYNIDIFMVSSRHELVITLELWNRLVENELVILCSSVRTVACILVF